MRTAICILIAGTLIGGCTATPRPSVTSEAQPVVDVTTAKSLAPAVTTAQARRILAADRSRVWKDPDSVREAKIGEPFACLNNDGTTCICLEANARNSMGGMAGLTYYVVRVNAAQAEMIGDFAVPEKCGKMIPFPEMNGRR